MPTDLHPALKIIRARVARLATRQAVETLGDDANTIDIADEAVRIARSMYGTMGVRWTDEDADRVYVEPFDQDVGRPD